MAVAHSENGTEMIMRTRSASLLFAPTDCCPSRQGIKRHKLLEHRGKLFLPLINLSPRMFCVPWLQSAIPRSELMLTLEFVWIFDVMSWLFCNYIPANFYSVIGSTSWLHLHSIGVMTTKRLECIRVQNVLKRTLKDSLGNATLANIFLI